MEVFALDAPASESVGDVRASAAVMLLADRIDDVLGGFAIDDRNASVVARAVWAVEGVPLAIELIAARTAVMPLADLADVGLDLAVGMPARRGGPERHRSIDACVAWGVGAAGGGRSVRPPATQYVRRVVHRRLRLRCTGANSE